MNGWLALTDGTLINLGAACFIQLVDDEYQITLISRALKETPAIGSVVVYFQPNNLDGSPRGYIFRGDSAKLIRAAFDEVRNK